MICRKHKWEHYEADSQRTAIRICSDCGKRQYRTYDIDACKAIWKDE